MPDEPNAASFDKSRAELFDALGHPVRIRILQALEEGPLGFSELRRKVGLESSGHLQFHLGKLDGLVRATPASAYELTDDGREALRVIGVQGESTSVKEARDGHKIILSRGVLAGLVALIVLLATVAVFQQTGIIPRSSVQPSASLPFPSTLVRNDSALQLTASVSITQINPGQRITVYADLYNPTNDGVQATASMDWGYSGFPFGGCSGHLLGTLNVYSGHLTMDEALNATPLPPYPPVEAYYCPYTSGPNVINFTFYPRSDVAMVENWGAFPSQLQSMYEIKTLPGYSSFASTNYTL
ncbi:MAG TPA: winged helix-turn-helix domain-containing protein, partial [Conexivisphaerales archaeon]|nr:winged helix-turn-helix domain-containing protein [Conexivisphaerales archaeon]